MRLSLVLSLILTCLIEADATGAEVTWRTLQRGVEHTTFQISAPTESGEGLMHAVRIDPKVARVVPVLASQRDRQRRTAGEWCREANLAVAINAGMFSADGISNVGYLRAGDHENTSKWNKYRSVLCLYPRSEDLPTLRWLDLGPNTPMPAQVREYTFVIQNLRLIRAPGRNVWSNGNKRWSEAAVALDAEGRLLFLFTRAPFPMSEFNHTILSLPLGIKQAMHVEGGPEASLSVHCGGLDLDLCGSFETGFLQDDSNLQQWAIPNVLGVERDR